MIKKLYITIMCICTFTLSGCASVVNGVNQSVSVSTPPTKAATCALSNSKGKWFVNKTPGSVVVHRAYGPLKIVCHKPGYVSATKQVESNTKAMAFGNVLMGGAIGAGVDVADGAAYDYPTNIIIPMHKISQKTKQKVKQKI
ncbi:MAG: hypothetical protein PVI75_00450 [Gammaproteobacteria bacterium]|jgi:uncharacterized protein YceK